MSNQVYPALVGAQMDVEREALYGTVVQTEASGRELRVAQQAGARYRYRIRYDFLRQDASPDEAGSLTFFFASHRGSWDSFLFTDVYYSSVTSCAFGTGTGSQTAFPLKDDLGDRVGANNGAISVYVAGVLKTVTTDYTIDWSPGYANVNFVSAPANGAALTWTGQFYRRCRFASDGLRLQRRFSRIWRGEVELVSVL